MKDDRLTEALHVLADLGLPRAQQNERSALTLLALLDLTPKRTWRLADAPLRGITPIMDWCRQHYGRDYAPNTRETFRRQTMHQFIQAGLVLYNPDDAGRAVNSPKAVYQISDEALALLRRHGASDWSNALKTFLTGNTSLASRYANAREMRCVSVRMAANTTIELSPGKHNVLIRDIIQEFAPRFAPDSTMIYVGDTGKKIGYFDRDALAALGVSVDNHGKMPDVILHYVPRNWLLLVESVTSHGPVDPKRHAELMHVFADSTAGLVYVTAFPTRSVLTRYIGQIAWETEVWIADAPSHLIHFNGDRFLGPHAALKS